MSTVYSREHVVSEMDFDTVTEAEAIQALALANAGYYTLDDIPVHWQLYFDDVERDLSTDL
ncbi:hypothetical protein [Halorubrum sp. F4]|uniref:hypothetical protein n=1 Tax=Halorubrum sp. F4 TaxID=2989715 RepID=UPI00247FF0D9|nr:hypothetical protein [Halorubrum sp. F4]